MHTDEQLRQIMDSARRRVFGSERPPQPVRVESYDVPCGICGETVRTLQKPSNGDLPPLCCECRDARTAEEQRLRAKREEDERAEWVAAQHAREAKALAAVRADLPGVLARCGVPLRWRDASFDDCPDLPQSVVDSATAWAKRPTGIVLYTGPAGAGKTWLAVAVLRAVLSAPVLAPKSVRYISEAAYLADLRAAFIADAKPQAKRAVPTDDARRVPLLIYDDLGSTRLTAWGAGAVAELIATRHAEDLTTIITSNLNLPEIASAVDGRTASRIADDRQVYRFPARDLRVRGKVSFRGRVLAMLAKCTKAGPTRTGPQI